MTDPLSTLTLATDYANLVVSLWLAFYLLPRVRTNRIAVRMIMVMLAVGGYYFLNVIGLPAVDSRTRTLPIILALLAGHNLTHYLLPESVQRKGRGLLQAGVLIGIIVFLSVLIYPTGETHGLVYIQASPIVSLDGLIGLFQVLLGLGILFNLWLLTRQGLLPINRGFLLALILGMSPILYSTVGFLVQISLPRFVASIMVMSFLLLLGYSFGRYQTLIERRILSRDLPLSAISTIAILAVYWVIAGGFDLSLGATAVLTVAVITTHALYAWIRENFQRDLARRSREYEREIRRLARKTADDEGLFQTFRRGLILLCEHLQADGAMLAFQEAGVFNIRVAHNALKEGQKIPGGIDFYEELVAAPDLLGQEIAWLAPGYMGDTARILLGIGNRKGLREYTDADLEWLQVIADHFAGILAVYAEEDEKDYEDLETLPAKAAVEKPEPRLTHQEAEDLLDALTVRPPAELVKHVEGGLKNLNDYIELGKSPLVIDLGVRGGTLIDRGRTVHHTLVNVLEMLRPEGAEPGEPLPAEWRKYIILHDAYVKQLPHRDIMGKLYIGDSTFYRYRRAAIHGVAGALYEAALGEAAQMQFI